MNGKDAVDFAGRADAEKTELELSGLDPDALGFMRAGERKKVLERAGLDPAKYDFEKRKSVGECVINFPPVLY